jgi:uncharacterized protein (DUF362 family)
LEKGWRACKITNISIIVAAIFGLVKEHGGVQFIIDAIKKRSKAGKAPSLALPVCRCW